MSPHELTGRSMSLQVVISRLDQLVSELRIQEAYNSSGTGGKSRITLALNELIPEQKTEEVEEEKENQGKKQNTKGDEPKIEEVVERKDKEKEEGSHERNQTNKNQPLRRGNSNDAINEDSSSLHKNLSNGPEENLVVSHFKVDGLEIRARLLVPFKAPSGPLETKQKRNNIKLNVRPGPTIDDWDELMPEWLHMVQGVVDSEGLPLNIPNETLQQSRILRAIKKSLVKTCSESLAEMAGQRGVHTDEDGVQQLTESDGKKLRAITKEALDNVDEGEQEKIRERKAESEPPATTEEMEDEEVPLGWPEFHDEQMQLFKKRRLRPCQGAQMNMEHMRRAAWVFWQRCESECGALTPRQSNLVDRETRVEQRESSTECSSDHKVNESANQRSQSDDARQPLDNHTDPGTSSSDSSQRTGQDSSQQSGSRLKLQQLIEAAPQ